MFVCCRRSALSRYQFDCSGDGGNGRGITTTQKNSWRCARREKNLQKLKWPKEATEGERNQGDSSWSAGPDFGGRWPHKPGNFVIFRSPRTRHWHANRNPLSWRCGGNPNRHFSTPVIAETFPSMRTAQVPQVPRPRQ